MTTRQRNQVMKAVEELGGVNRIHEELVEYSGQVERLEAMREKLTKEHPDMWVAMANNAIVAVADTLKEVLSEIDAQGIPRTEVVVEFLNTKPQSLIL
ncbi:MAG: DUF5678 domain-containing protein [Chloroflexi bacterium]|nr:DUF5678 domain-containing protein [Chloroflexota bacterium]